MLNNLKVYLKPKWSKIYTETPTFPWAQMSAPLCGKSCSDHTGNVAVLCRIQSSSHIKASSQQWIQCVLTHTVAQLETESLWQTFKTSGTMSFFKDQKCSFNKGAAMQSSQCKLRQSLAMVKLIDVLSAFYMGTQQPLLLPNGYRGYYILQEKLDCSPIDEQIPKEYPSALS